MTNGQYDKWRTLILWLCIGIIAGPLAIITHEAGHFLAAKSLGYTEVEFHYASINRGQSPHEAERPHDRGVISVAGPLVTLLMALGCCLYASQKSRYGFFMTLGISTPLRNLASIVALVFVFIGKDVSGNDEVKVASFFNFHPTIPLLVSGAVLVFTWIYLIPLMLKRHGRLALAASLAGIILGNVVWLTVLGPAILP